MSEFDNKPLPSLLRQLRGRESLRHASNRIGISHNYLNNLEKGVDPRTGKEIRPSPDILEKISFAYSYSYNNLMIAAGYTNNTDTNNEPIDLKELLSDKENLLWGRKLISGEEKRKVITIIDTMLGDN